MIGTLPHEQSTIYCREREENAIVRKATRANRRAAVVSNSCRLVFAIVARHPRDCEPRRADNRANAVGRGGRRARHERGNVEAARLAVLKLHAATKARGEAAGVGFQDCIKSQLHTRRHAKQRAVRRTRNHLRRLDA